MNPVAETPTDTQTIHFGEQSNLTEAEVTQAVRSLKAGKATGCDDIRPEMLKDMDLGGILWQACVCQVSWSLGKTPRD